jgi:hypothetical protein
MSPTRYAAAAGLAVALAAGGYAIGSSGGGDRQATANAAQTGPPGMAQNGQKPPGFGTAATGAAAKEAKAAALARYKGTANRVMKLQDGSYLVPVQTSKGDYQVHVSKAFTVTGAAQGGPGGRPAPPSGAPS